MTTETKTVRHAYHGEASSVSPFFFPVIGGGICASPRQTFVTKIGPKGLPAGHVFAAWFAYSHNMRGAFVIQLGPESNPAEDRFEGWVEEVDSCIELRFRSTEELLKFMGLRFDLVKGSSSKTSACEVSDDPPGKKSSQKAKKSK